MDREAAVRSIRAYCEANNSSQDSAEMLGIAVDEKRWG
jgi:hypothetical protein